jgi:N-acetylglucosaminyldiphosphoundecaprenol N-acetyl-beta-D-mannosaminyltransferase
MTILESSCLQSPEIDRVNILGVKVSALNMNQTIQRIIFWCSEKIPNYVCVTPAHGIMDCWSNPDLRSIFNGSGMTTPDGMAVVWLLKLYGYKSVSRVYGPDLMLSVCQISISQNYRHFFYGGAPGVAEKLAENLRFRYPGLQISGIYSPPYRELTPDEDQNIIHQINTACPDIVWVGISTPKQERWMQEHVRKLNAPVLIGVGAAFDFLSGNKKQAPKWMQKYGLEWLFRFLSEPRRLWRRYIKYPLFVILAMAQYLGITHYE